MDTSSKQPAASSRQPAASSLTLMKAAGICGSMSNSVVFSLVFDLGRWVGRGGQGWAGMKG